jgi:predicted dehydrogenase
VLCEKPLGLDPAAVEAMAAAAARNDRLLVEAFWYRWHPRTRWLERVLAEGTLGPLQRVEADFSFAGAGDGDPERHYRLNPRRGGGGIYDVGCYALSAAHLALGPRLDVIRGWARRGPTGVDLEASAQLEVPPDGSAGEASGGLAREASRGLAGGGSGGATATIRCAISGADRQAIAVIGEAARVDFGAPAFTALHTPVVATITTSDGVVRTEEFAPIDPYRLMVEAVAAQVRGENAFLPGLDHSRQVAATTAALLKAT